MTLSFATPGPFGRRRHGGSPTRNRSAGFTLIELVVVVFIIGLIYGVAINSIDRTTEGPEAVRLETVRDYMQQQHRQNHLSLICIDDCSTCALYTDGAKVRELPPFVDRHAEYYRFNYYRGAELLEWPPLYTEEGREEEVCFRYDLYPDGSSSEMMVQYGDRVLDFPGFFGDTTAYASMEEAVRAKQARYEEIRR
jgi:prepilin-type N-terminal cleavage/methylation domain-containing protein